MAASTASVPSGSSLYESTSNELEVSSDESLSSNDEESSSSISGIPADKSKVVSLLSRLNTSHAPLTSTRSWPGQEIDFVSLFLSYGHFGTPGPMLLG